MRSADQSVRATPSVEGYNLVIVAAALQRVVEGLQEFRAVAREEVNGADFSLLQDFVRVERVAELLGMASDDFTLAHFRTSSASPQAFQLMLHLRRCVVGGFHQCLVETNERGFHGAKRLIE